MYNQDTKLAILCNVNTVRDKFLFTLVEYNYKGYSSSWFFFYLKTRVERKYRTVSSVGKFILGLNLTFLINIQNVNKNFWIVGSVSRL